MRFNIFRNPHVDAQVGYLIDSMIDARRKETEVYWRNKVVDEILERIEWIPKDDGGYCFTIHYCDVVELIELSQRKS